ncbi:MULTISPECIES: IS66 family insertion sequence element accessory protein TnpB [Vibrio]|uniref:IS66 family insertion sequence element accessory protein TnpB n=1 Tax=Vibrio TaxID=662 RepID=UPI00292A1775|nr:transposase [Vibrio sp. 2-1-2a]MDU9605378.1 transposase [Vibrio sp. 1-2-3a]MEA3484269.1 IS66 family insertion sequence element accessory protein TnpB [Pseudomonadota bacterium]HCG6158253.1 IS66 family insertion sequence element accessory protein TnpB [Vibrio parahaemolyticus]
MIHLTAQTQILLAIKPADFRCGIDGFVALCRHQLKQEPRSGTLFVFTNRRRTMLRALSRLAEEISRDDHAFSR